MLYVGCRGRSRVSDVLADLKSATHYFHLRDLLYYTYTAPGSTPWTFDEGKVKILYADVSLPHPTSRHPRVEKQVESLEGGTISPGLPGCCVCSVSATPLQRGHDRGGEEFREPGM